MIINKDVLKELKPCADNFSKYVSKKLEFLGWSCFDIGHDNANGADITIARNGKTYRAEIKKACYGSRSYKTTPVGRSGKKCDLIIIILPNGNLLIQPMKDHLALCSDKGSRFITKLVEVNI